MSKLRKDADKSPIFHIAVISLMAIGLSSLPLDKLFYLFIEDKHLALTLSGSVLRLILSAVAIFLICKYRFNRAFYSFNAKGLLLILPAFLVVIFNSPIIALINNGVTFNQSGVNVFTFILYCLSVGLFEETVFRGLIFPLCLNVTKKSKLNLFYAVALCSGIFAILHLFNLLGGANVGATFLQVGYSFLIGGLCAICLAVTKNLFIPVILHAIFDFGGLMLNNPYGIGVGNQWDVLTIILTAVIGVLTCAYMVVLCLKTEKEKVHALYTEKEN